MIWIALAYHLASRLAYVLYVGLTLKRQDRAEYLTQRYGVEAGFQRFRRVAAFVMANDAVSLAVLCLVSADTLRVGLPLGLAIATSSAFGLAAAVFDQCAILAFYHLVEKPHFERLRRAPAEAGVRSVPGSARPPSLDTAPGQPP